MKPEEIFDPRKAEKLINWEVSHTFQGYHDLDELRSAGRIGLAKAYAEYNRNRGEFPPFAKVCIRNEITCYLRPKCRKPMVSVEDIYEQELTDDRFSRIDDWEEIERLIPDPYWRELLLEHLGLGIPLTEISQRIGRAHTQFYREVKRYIRILQDKVKVDK